MQQVGHRLLNGLLWLFGLVPTLWFLAFYTFVIRSRLSLGRWPEPYQPDPATFAFDAHHWLIIALMILVIPSAIGFAAVRVFRRLQGEASPADRPLTIFFIATYVLWWLVARVDPGDFITWFLD